MTQDPSLPDVIRAAILNRQADAHFALPGSIVSYDSAKQKAIVQILVRRPDTDESGERIAVRVAPLTNVPIVFPGSGPYSITWPLAKGDTVLVLFSEASIDKWLVSTGGEVDPQDGRRGSYSDAIAIPGLRTFKTAISSPGTDALTLTADAIKLGSASATDNVMRKSDAQRLRDALGLASTALSANPTAKAAVDAIITALDSPDPLGVEWLPSIDSIVKAN